MDNIDLNQDLLSGTKAISGYWGCNERRGFYLLEKGLIPGFKLGHIWHARKSTIRAHVAEREAAAMAERVA